MDALTVDVVQQGEQAVIDVRGELDDVTAAVVRAIDLEDLATSGCTDVLVDLSGLDFLDSSGIGAFVGLRNRAVALDLTLVLRSAPPHVQHTLTIAGLAELFGLKR